jgi:hypothetical protein
MVEDYPVDGLKNLSPSEHQVIHLLKISNELKAVKASLYVAPTVDNTQTNTTTMSSNNQDEA